MKITRTGYTVTFTAEESAVDNIINKIFSGNTQREMPVFTEEAFEEPEAIAEQDIFSEYVDDYRAEAYYNAIEVYADEDNITEPVVVIFGEVNSEQHDNSFTITDEHAADLRDWFYRTFTEFIGCDVDTNILVNLYKMRLRATECTLNFEQYLRSYAYDLLMFNTGIVDNTMPCYGDLKFINWLLTDENAYQFIKMYVDAFNTAKVIRPVLEELICIFGGEQSQEQVEQSEEDLLMKLNYDEYTMKVFNEARRKQLAS